MCIFSIYQIVYHKKAKNLKKFEISQKHSMGLDKHKWKITEEQNKVTEEAKR